MASGENFLAQLKAVVDPMMVFSHYISFKKAGARYRALCPFHSEKTPSFYASENGMFHCFGCGVGGDVIKFVMLMEKMDFKEAIQVLGQRYGIPLKFTSAGDRKEKEDLLDLMRQAADFYHNLLTTHSSGREALAYLQQRGVTDETIRKFQLGWAPESWNSLLQHFEKRDVAPELLERAGLVIARQNQGGHFDRYRSRIMIPIHDIHGNVIGLGGRIFNGGPEDAKYMNSPETTLYSKSQQLFGLYLSKEHIQASKSAILVEGYFDLILPFQAGHKNIVASLGTSLTENQARLLRRYTDQVTLFYDPDTAGQSAALRALPILLKENFLVRVGSLPDGMDPDELIRKRGTEEFEKQVDLAIRYDRLFVDSLLQKHDTRTPAGKLAATEELFALLSSIGNPFEREQMTNRFASAIGAPAALLQDQFRRKRGTAGDAHPEQAIKEKIPELEKQLLQVFLLSPETALRVLPEMNADDFEDLACADLFRQLQQIIIVDQVLNTAEIIHALPIERQSAMTSLVMDEEAPPPTEENARTWVEAVRQARTEREIRRLNLEIEEARRAKDETRLTKLLEQKLALGRQVRKIPGSAPNRS